MPIEETFDFMDYTDFRLKGCGRKDFYQDSII
jgi:hypothetical protein